MKTHRFVISMLSIILVAIVGVGAFLFMRYRQTQKQPQAQIQTQHTTTPTETTTLSTTSPTQVTEPKHAHSYIAEKKAATCTEGGYTLHACTCGDSYCSDETKAKGHMYGTAKEKEATCTKKGGLVKTCETCGHKKTENVIAALGHDWSSWETTKEATNSSSGKKVRTCERCNKTEKKTIAKIKAPAHKHSYTKKVVDATCEKKGYTLYTCACGKSYKSDYTPLRSHLYGEWEIVKKSTATSAGKKEAKCQRCGKVITDTIPKPSVEDEALYKQYIDPKIKIKRLPDGATRYYYNKVSVIDVRGWGDPPYLCVTSSGGIHFIYAKKDGTKVEWTVEPVEGYVRRLVIQKDGTYTVSLIGGFDD